MPINLESSDGRMETFSITFDLAPTLPGFTEVEALRQVIAEMRVAPSSSRRDEALAAITSPEGIRQLLRESLVTKNISDDMRRAFHLQWTVRSHRIREMFDDDRLLADVLWRILPPYNGPGRTIYRGEQALHFANGRVGFNWSSDREVARMFASGLCATYPGGGVLLQAYAATAAFISGSSPHSIYLGENEMVVDPRRIEKIIELARYQKQA